MSDLKNINAALERTKNVKEVFTLDFVSDRTIRNYELATGRKDGKNWFEREAMAIMAIFAEKPNLAKCDKLSIWGALMTSARKGLSIAEGDVDLIPYGNILKADPNYKGLRKQLRRMPEIKFINEAQVVFKGEEFVHDKLINKITKHESKIPPSVVTLDVIVAAYVRLEFTDGHVADVVMYHAALQNAYNKSPNKSATGPWALSTEEMCKKSVVKRANKVHYNAGEGQIPDDEFKKFEVEETTDTTYSDVKEEVTPVPQAAPPVAQEAVVAGAKTAEDF